MKNKHISIVLLSAPVLAFSALGLSRLLEMLKIGSLWLILMFFALVCVPVITFSLLAGFNKSRSATGKRKVILNCAAFLVMIATVFGNFLIAVLPDFDYGKGFFQLFVIWGIIWAVACGLLILGNSAMARSYSGKPSFKVFLAIEGIAVLVLLALFTYYASDMIHMHSIELMLLPFTSVVGAMYSYFLGKSMEKKHSVPKLALWLMGVLAAKFVMYSILGTPHTPPTAHFLSLVLWLGSSALIFAFAVIGVFRQKSKKID